ncbi:hypothetical protein [Mycobacterium sp. 141]|uniref:hypothetical protein n=1 Tax=Mycobacterium sp. 141 TaxID=1120797 RepID=UPI00036BC59C|nr:hypothetical protein [Mycobacterium sp. 141]
MTAFVTGNVAFGIVARAVWRDSVPAGAGAESVEVAAAVLAPCSLTTPTKGES